MKYVGAHVSIAGGVQNAPLHAAKIGAKGFAMFTKNQRQWTAYPYSKENISEFHKNLEALGAPRTAVLPHVGYLLNLGHPEEEKRQKSLDALIDEMDRVQQLGLVYLNLHPGTTLGKISRQQCKSLIAQSINQGCREIRDVVLILETTAGQGYSVGCEFEDLTEIIEQVDDKERIGVCIDTCHIFAAGYDIRTKETYEHTMSEFDRIVGFNYLKAFHLNDAKSAFGSKVDRHHSLGCGNIGLDTFRFIMADTRLDEMVFVLETIDYSIWDKEVALLYEYYNQANP